MSTCTTLNKGLIMRCLPYKSDVQATQASAFSDLFAHIESGFNHFRSIIHNPRARVAAISKVNKEVDAAMRLLRTVRNALAPISLLPPEVLARVFRFHSLEEPPSSRKQNLGWIRATHVCQLWRQVALGDSSLWARISCVTTNTKLISEMLSRARNMPLDIGIDLDVTTISEMLHIFPPRLSHTRKLRLHIVTSLSSDSFREIYCHEAPALEHFELDSLDPLTFCELGGTTLFKGQAPKLRTLIISQVLIPWSLIPRGQLTQLEISLEDEVSIANDTSRGDLNQLIDLLVNSPRLEVLVLESCLPSQLSDFPYVQTIRLPHLSRLCLGGSSSRIANLLKMLKLPSSTTLQLYCDSENTSTYNDHLLLRIFSAHFQNSSPIEFKCLKITLSCGGSWFDMTASTSPPKSRVRRSSDLKCDIDDDDDDKFVLYMNGLPEHDRCTDLLEGVCNVLPISNLESLVISAPGTVDRLNWVELFKRCTKLTTLQVIGRGMSSLVRALATSKVTNTRRERVDAVRPSSKHGTPEHPARSTALRARAPIFPKLTSLSLKWLDFAEIESSGVLFDVVQKGLQQRMVAHGLKTLCIDHCAISFKRAKALQKLVQRFHWDKKERFEDHDRPEPLLEVSTK